MSSHISTKDHWPGKWKRSEYGSETWVLKRPYITDILASDSFGSEFFHLLSKWKFFSYLKLFYEIIF